MPRYLLSVNNDYSAPPPTAERMREFYESVGALEQQLHDEGAWVFGAGLGDARQAVVVDASGPAPLMTEGPFAEAREHLGGFWVVEARDQEHAQAIAVRASGACGAPIEVRAVQQDSDG